MVSDDSPLNSELKCCPLVISVQQEMIAALDRWLSFLRNHLKLAELAAKYIHRCGKAFTLDLPPTSRAPRWFFGVSQGSAAYTEMARLRLWPESHNLARTASLHRKTALQQLADEGNSSRTDCTECAVEVQIQQMWDDDQSPPTLAVWSLATVVRARLRLF